MSLTPADVSRIAQLARLNMNDDERAAMLPQLNRFLELAQHMSAVDTGGVQPLYTPLSAVQEVALRLRADVVSEANDRQANQRSAPALQGGLFLVPRVIE